MFNKLISLMAVVLVASTSWSTPSLSVEKLPIEAFASLPSLSRVQMSPSGNKIAFMTTMEGRRHILVTNLQTNKSVLVPPHGDAELGTFFWGNEESLIIAFTVTRRRFRISRILTERKLFSFNTNTLEYTWFGKPKRRRGSMHRTQGPAAFAEYIVHSLPDDPEHVLMQLDEDLVGRPDVFKVNINSGRRLKVKNGRQGIWGWYADQEGNVRLGTGYYRTGSFATSEKRVSMLFDKNGDTTNLEKTDWFDKYDIVDFSPDPNILYVSGPTEFGTKGIFTLDVRTGEILEPIFAHPKVDIGRTVRHPETRAIAGVGYTLDTYVVKYFDKDLAKIQRTLKKALKSDVYIVGKARNKELYMVVATATNNPGDYYMYHRETGQLNLLSPTMADIYPEDMPKTLVTEIPTRDGASIPAFVTLPLGSSKGDKLPTVILPHGGPHARDTADWDFWSQFYANRGYAVMRPNFRGSTGYGKAFLEAGENRWGGLMQDDVTDATLWMINEGYSAPERICIVGASYGGYAAMFGPIKEPDLYKCAISVNGVPDIPRMKQSDKLYIGFSEWLEKMGHADKNDSEVSPYHQADKLNVPLLLMSSVDDSRVPYKMSQRMQNRMENLNKESRYVEIANGGHSMITKEARMTLLTETEKFLAKHIGH